MKRTRLIAPLGQGTTSPEARSAPAQRRGTPRSSTWAGSPTKSSAAAVALVAALAVGLVLSPAMSFAGVTDRDGARRFSTGPKLVQIDNMNGEQLTAQAAHVQVVDQASPREPVKRRSFRAAPTEPVSVGLIGCPGCMEILEVVRPVFVDRRGPRRSSLDRVGPR